jgi:hypothetical protein
MAGRAQRASQGLAVVEGADLVAHDLGGLVALAGHQQDVAGTGELDARGDGPGPIGLDDEAVAGGMPRCTASMIAAGSSLRGLSVVSTT